MYRKLGSGILIFCFSLSSVNLGLAAQVVEIPPVIVQPDDLQEISQQMIEQDRINRDQELAIRGLMDDNQKLTDTAQARKQDATLDKINQTMIKYRDALLSRDQARIAANSGKPWTSRYGDLVKLTEDADAMTVHQDLVNKNDLLVEKFQMLSALKDEMKALNEKLKSQSAVHENIENTTPEQEDKILMLTQRLGEMDHRITHYDDVLAQKNQRIAQLADNLAQAQAEIVNLKHQPNDSLAISANRVSLPPIIVNTSETTPTPPVTPIVVQVAPAAKPAPIIIESHSIVDNAVEAQNESIHWLKLVLAVSKIKTEYYQLTAQIDQLMMRQFQRKVQKLRGDFDRQSQQDEKFFNDIASLKGQINQLALKLSQKQAQEDDRIKLAQQLIDLQQQEIALLREKNGLLSAQDTTSDQHAASLENKIKEVVANNQIQTAELQNSLEEMKNERDQKAEQVETLRTDLNNKIAQQQNQTVLTEQIQDLQAQLKDKENQIAAMKSQILSGQQAQAQADALKEQLADQQNKADMLKQELDAKTYQSNQMTVMLQDYQKKLESKNNAFNEQLGQFKDLNAQLEEKDAQDRDAQAHELNLSMAQQTANAKQAQEITKLEVELAAARLTLSSVPSADEIKFLRTGLDRAMAQLKQKDAMLSQIKANAAEYDREFKEQTKEFQSLKDQLQDAFDEIKHKNEDLKYKDMEITRLKERPKISTGRNIQIKSEELPFSKNDAASEKLNQALDKIDQQGRIINILVQKLQECGQNVDLTKLGQ